MHSNGNFDSCMKRTKIACVNNNRSYHDSGIVIFISLRIRLMQLMPITLKFGLFPSTARSLPRVIENILKKFFVQNHPFKELIQIRASLRLSFFA